MKGHQARNEKNPASLAGKRVLIVEDSPLIAASSDEMIRGFGCSVVGPAQNMADALDLAQSAAIDVATVDLNIRGGKAFPLLRIVRRRNVPFLITSGYANWSNAGRVGKRSAACETLFASSIARRPSETHPRALEKFTVLFKPYRIEAIEKASGRSVSGTPEDGH